MKFFVVDYCTYIHQYGNGMMKIVGQTQTEVMQTSACLDVNSLQKLHIYANCLILLCCMLQAVIVEQIGVGQIINFNIWADSFHF